MTPLASLFALSVALQAAGEPSRVDVEPETARVAVEHTVSLTARAVDGSERPLEGILVRWFSLDPELLSVDADGVVRGIRPGRGRVAAVVAGRLTGFAEIEVEELPPATLELEIQSVRLVAGTSAPLRVTAINRLGDLLSDPDVRFTVSDTAVASVDAGGRVFARRAGEARIAARAGQSSATLDIVVEPDPGFMYELSPSVLEARTGDVLRFRVSTRTADGTPGPELRPAWTVSGSGAEISTEDAEGVFVAERPGRYLVYAVIGEGRIESARVRVTERRSDAELVKVGRGAISSHHSGDMWVFEGVDGRDYVYIGTFMHDWMKVWDVTDPASPVLTDSLRLDARRINDVKIHPDGHIGIVTREGASNRRNGIVILDLSVPAHPTILSEYQETVTGGVHNVWIRGNEDLVYACHNGTSDLHIIDISDPANPREVGRWGLEKQGKTLHDVIVQDGYAYLSYWNDGIIMLDVGAGTHGGTPTSPAFVSQYRHEYGNTHVAWRSGRYLFVGDEIFPAGWDADRPIAATGFIHVVDYSDIENPVEVAKYEVPEAGAHNVWVDGDRLYVGYYQGGLRVVDISGELRGDLYRQGREIARLLTTDEETTVPNWPMAWGAQIFKGRIYSSDLNSGLWITRLVDRRVVF